LEALAFERDCSVAALVRQSIDDLIQKVDESILVQKRRRAAAAAGRFHSGQTDISENHDDYLVLAYSL
jgi:hypothetical protein